MAATLALEQPHAESAPGTEQLEEIDEGELWDEEDVTHALIGGGDPASMSSTGALARDTPDTNGVASPSLRPHTSFSSDNEGLDAVHLDQQLASAALERQGSAAAHGLPAPTLQQPPVGSLKAGLTAADFAGPRPAAQRPSSDAIDVGSASPSRLLRTASDAPASVRRIGEAAPSPPEAKMGTSVPVAIPMAARMMNPTPGPPNADDGEGDSRAATFVPPHQLLQRMSGADRFSLGVSAGGESASLKRDRLVQRNAILRRTGFIEGGGRMGLRTSSFLETIPAVNEADVEAGSSYGRPSALSAALGTSLGTSPAEVRRRTYN